MSHRKSISGKERLRLFAEADGLRLQGADRHRGRHLPASQIHQLEEFCLQWLRQGAIQGDLVASLNATRSQVSRWSRTAVGRAKQLEDTSLLKTRGTDEAQVLFSRIDFPARDRCWIWLGGIKPNGYGSWRFRDQSDQAHRAVYRVFVGPIEDGKQIDHRCGNPSCVNPFHLEPVSPSENLYRANRKPVTVFQRTARQRLSGRDRQAILLEHNRSCHLCGGEILPDEGFEISHPLPLALGGEDTPDNRRPAHKKCHRHHTSTVDAPNIAKAKRRELKNLGAVRPKRPWPKRSTRQGARS